MLSDSLRDRFVCGLKSEFIQNKLLTEAGLTFEKAVELAVAMETASRDIIELHSKHVVSQHNASSPGINALKFNQRSSKKGGQKQSGKPCFRCNSTGHLPKDCYYVDKPCHKCNKIGHCKKACRSSLGGEKKKIHNVDISDDELFIGSLEINSLKDVISLSPKIDGIPIPMELDTGAAVSVISKDTYCSAFPDKLDNLIHTDSVLKTFSGEKIKLVGIAKVDVTYNNQNYCGLDLYVPNTGQTLFGREWLRQINLDWH